MRFVLHCICHLVSTLCLCTESVVNPRDITLKLVWQTDELLPGSACHRDLSELLYP